MKTDMAQSLRTKPPSLPPKSLLWTAILLMFLPIALSILVWRLVQPPTVTGGHVIGIVINQPDQDSGTAYGIRAAMDYYGLRDKSGMPIPEGVTPPRLLNLNWSPDQRNAKGLEEALRKLTLENGLPPAFVPGTWDSRPPIIPILGIWTTNETFQLKQALMNLAGDEQGYWTVQFMLENVTLSSDTRREVVKDLKSKDKGNASPLIFTGAFNDDQAKLLVKWVVKVGEHMGHKDDPEAFVILPPHYEDDISPYAKDLRRLIDKENQSKEGETKKRPIFKDLDWQKGLDTISDESGGESRRIFVILDKPDAKQTEEFNTRLNPPKKKQKQTDYFIFTDAWHNQSQIQELSRVETEDPTSLAVLSTLREAALTSPCEVSGIARCNSTQTTLLEESIANPQQRASWVHLFGKTLEARFAYGWDLYVSYLMLQQRAYPNAGETSPRPLRSLLKDFDLEHQFDGNTPTDLWGYGRNGLGSWAIEFPKKN